MHGIQASDALISGNRVGLAMLLEMWPAGKACSLRTSVNQLLRLFAAAAELPDYQASVS
jgi:hypothetical protein